MVKIIKLKDIYHNRILNLSVLLFGLVFMILPVSFCLPLIFNFNKYNIFDIVMSLLVTVFIIPFVLVGVFISMLGLLMIMGTAKVDKRESECISELFIFDFKIGKNIHKLNKKFNLNIKPKNETIYPVSTHLVKQTPEKLSFSEIKRRLNEGLKDDSVVQKYTDINKIILKTFCCLINQGIFEIKLVEATTYFFKFNTNKAKDDLLILPTEKINIFKCDGFLENRIIDSVKSKSIQKEYENPFGTPISEVIKDIFDSKSKEILLDQIRENGLTYNIFDKEGKKYIGKNYYNNENLQSEVNEVFKNFKYSNQELFEKFKFSLEYEINRLFSSD